MKTLLLGLTLFAIPHVYATEVETQKYKLIKYEASERNYTHKCSNEIEVQMNNEGVFVNSMNDSKTSFNFYADTAGCEDEFVDFDGLIKGTQESCVEFTTSGVSETKSFWSLSAGYFGQETSIKKSKKDSDILIIDYSTTTVPLGLFLAEVPDYKCTYTKL